MVWKLDPCAQQRDRQLSRGAAAGAVRQVAERVCYSTANMVKRGSRAKHQGHRMQLQQSGKL